MYNIYPLSQVKFTNPPRMLLFCNSLYWHSRSSAASSSPIGLDDTQAGGLTRPAGVPELALEAQLISNTIVLYTRMPPKSTRRGRYRGRGRRKRGVSYSAPIPYRGPRISGLVTFKRKVGSARYRGLPGLNFVPKTKVLKLKYDTEVTLNATDVIPASYVFRCNSLYDPEETSIGHSHYMFDQIMLLYRKYRVIGSKIKVWSIYPAGVTAGASYCTIIRTATGRSTSSFASGAHILESNIRGNVKIIGQTNDGILAPGGQRTILTHTYSQKKQFPGIQDKQLEGLYNTNPELEYFWELIQFSMGQTNPPLAYFRVEIESTAIFSEPIVMSESGVDENKMGIGGAGPLWLSQGTGGTGVLQGYAAGDGGEQGSTGPQGMVD